MILEYILIGVLLAAAVFLVVVVLLQKSDKEGLSGTIVGGAETYYGKDKASQTGKKLFKLTLIMSVIFAIVVLAVYVMQPDYSADTQNAWTELSSYSESLK